MGLGILNQQQRDIYRTVFVFLPDPLWFAEIFNTQQSNIEGYLIVSRAKIEGFLILNRAIHSSVEGDLSLLASVLFLTLITMPKVLGSLL